MPVAIPKPAKHDRSLEEYPDLDQVSSMTQATPHRPEPQLKKPEFLRRPGLLTPDPDAIAAQFPFVAADAVLADLDADTKEEAIVALVGRLAKIGVVNTEDQGTVTAAILHREELGTTGIGRHLAIPHAKHPAVTQVVAAVGYCPRGIDFNSLDGQAVHLIILVLSPPDSATEHLQALAEISRYLIQQKHERGD
jgi:mannitol/fructose-specific phosphotransferase system IIA component (Ntr-type)